MTNYERLIVTHAIEEIEKLQAEVNASEITIEKCALIGSSDAVLSHLRTILATAAS